MCEHVACHEKHQRALIKGSQCSLWLHD
jgi:hypothetical protein